MNSQPNNTTAHHSTVELSNCKLSLRTDLSFHLQEYNDAPCYLIEDEFNSRFYRVGLAEYHLISLLDGNTTINKAVSQSAIQLGDQAINEQDAITICKWLIDSGLATTDASRTSGRLMEAFEKSDKKKRMAKMNPVTPKFSLFNPDAFLTVLNQVFGWLFSFPMFLIWCAVVATGIYQTAANWDLITGGSSVFSSDNWLWLGVAWLGLKLLHETAHGLACKRFGGDVRQCGLVMIVMIPLPFVDVTSSWRFPSKWHRIFVAGAGMYVEVFCAAVAAIIWCYSDVGVVRQHCFNIMLAGSVTTLFFNANPLMRFDGYYMLSDWLEMPNLGTHGQQWIKWVGKKFYLGLEAKKPSWPEGRAWIVGTYAILALIWKVLICVGLAIAAESLFFGAGIILAFMAICVWVFWPIIKLLKMVYTPEETTEAPSKLRFCVLTTALLLACFAVYQYAPWYSRIKAPAIVDYQESHEVRTPVGGFLEEILVEPSQVVRENQLLARLKNPQVDGDVKKLKIELQANELRLRQHRTAENMPSYNVELKNRVAIEERLQERLEQQRQLEVRATAGGIVVADDLQSNQGTYLARGHKLCSIESDDRKEVHAMVSQHDFELFQSRIGQEVEVHIWGEGTGYFPAKLSHLNPRGRNDMPHPAFAATAGGPLPVKYSAPSEDPEAEEKNPVELVDPHFLARIELPEGISQAMRSGQPALVSFRTSRGSFGEVLSEKVSNWIERLREQTKAMSF